MEIVLLAVILSAQLTFNTFKHGEAMTSGMPAANMLKEKHTM